MANVHYMKPEKGDGDVVRVPANEWGNYRAKGYVFCDKADYDAQTAANAEVAKTASKKKAKKKTSG